jgi:hypothetical protein
MIILSGRNPKPIVYNVIYDAQFSIGNVGAALRRPSFRPGDQKE